MRHTSGPTAPAATSPACRSWTPSAVSSPSSGSTGGCRPRFVAPGEDAEAHEDLATVA